VDPSYSSNHAASEPDRAVILFVRAPDRGFVKTRLAADLGPDEALAIYRRLTEHTLAQLRAVRRCRVVLYVTPPGRAGAVSDWLGNDLEIRLQDDGDLGERLASALDRTLTEGASSVLAVGADCPGMESGTIESAFRELVRCDVVLGPALDGGYYLIGVKRRHPALFGGIPWSTPGTLSATLSAAASAGLSVALLEARRDIDTIDDWRAWCAEAPEWGAYASASRSGRAPAR
jgi:rSAM/selenodomain-associated transferase 1